MNNRNTHAVARIVCLIISFAMIAGAFSGCQPAEKSADTTAVDTSDAAERTLPAYETEPTDMTGNKDGVAVYPISEIPEVFGKIAADNAFEYVQVYADRLIKWERLSSDWEARTVEQKITVMDLYGRETSSYTFTSRDAHRITALIPTSDGGYIFALGFEDVCYDHDSQSWASDYGVESKIIKCDKNSNPQFEVTLDNVTCGAFFASCEKDGKYYFFGQIGQNRTHNYDDVTDIYTLAIGSNGEIIREHILEGSDFDNYNGLEETEDGFLLSVRTQSTDGDFVGCSGSIMDIWVLTLDTSLEVTDKKTGMLRNWYMKRVGEKDGKDLYFNDPFFKGYEDGMPIVYIDYGEYYLIVSRNNLDAQRDTPTSVNLIRFETETVYSVFDKYGNRLFRAANRPHPEYTDYTDEETE